MDPIKVNAYGLIEITKKQYIIVQIVVLVILALIFWLSNIFNLDQFLFGNAKITILVVLFLEFIEAFFMYRKFREKENQNINNGK